MTSPYDNLPPSAFWRTAVAERSPLDPGKLFDPRFQISKTDRIVTAGSCFAQHVGRTLKEASFNVLDLERLPPHISDDIARKYGYRLYSARYGNIYTPRQLLQLFREALGDVAPGNGIWESKGRYYDAFRPSVEPLGLPRPEDVVSHRSAHLAAVRTLLTEIDILVFTFGLTEAWVSTEDETVYPTAPGTIAGNFDARKFAFKNFSFSEVISDFIKVRRIVKRHNPDARFLITVSPVPLTATMSGRHVEVATAQSKATLRAVCGELYDRFDDVDYFPSYEVITSQAARGAYYDPNLRNVSKQGVATAMSLFMSEHGDRGPGSRSRESEASRQSPSDRSDTVGDLICEEALLEAFVRK